MSRTGVQRRVVVNCVTAIKKSERRNRKNTSASGWEREIYDDNENGNAFYWSLERTNRLTRSLLVNWRKSFLFNVGPSSLQRSSLLQWNATQHTPEGLSFEQWHSFSSKISLCSHPCLSVSVEVVTPRNDVAFYSSLPPRNVSSRADQCSVPEGIDLCLKVNVVSIYVWCTRVEHW